VIQNILAILCILAVGVTMPSEVRGQEPPPATNPDGQWASFDDDLDGEDLEILPDPWEPFNRKMFAVNMWLDDWAIRPLATGYSKVLPLRARRSIDNFFFHVRFPVRFINFVLQGKPVVAYREVGRFVTNTTLGIAGLFDPAADWYDAPRQETDCGLTLGRYGVPAGPYLVVPFFGPSTVRDTVGFVADLAMDPLSYTIGGTAVFVSRAAAEFSNRVNQRSLNLNLFEEVDPFTLDLYVAVQDFYMQKRERDVRQ
jgi:phospholipid-binding lipoprotein MlaA